MNITLDSAAVIAVDTPLGCLAVTSDGRALTGIHLLEPGQPVPGGTSDEPEPSVLRKAREQLAAYFRGELRDFDLPLNPRGTEFQRQVWKQLQRIPYGTTITYGELAARIGSPNASRAVGMANGRNPLMIVVPCHRVIGASGKLVGFSAGLHVKEKLLALEHASPPSLGL